MKKEVINDSTGLDTTHQTENKEPPLYRVILHNDDRTPMEFVIETLERFFFLDRTRAMQIMLEAHVTGKACCGVYTKDAAETKVTQVLDYARLKAHPLICSMEAA